MPKWNLCKMCKFSKLSLNMIMTISGKISGDVATHDLLEL